MSDKSGQLMYTSAATAMALLFGLAVLAGAFPFQSALAGIAAPDANVDAARRMEAIPEPEPHVNHPACGPPAVAPALIRELTTWIAAKTDYDTALTMRDPPVVTFCDTGETIRYEGKDIIVDAQLRAAYDLRRRRIFLVLPWSASDARDVSTLLHELIHDVQFSNRRWLCNGETEWEAYKLQEAWLAENGLASGFDWPQIFLLSRCPRDIHP